MKSLNNDWYKYINFLIGKYFPNDEIQKYAWSYKTPDLKSTKNNKLSQHRLKKTLQEKMKQNFIDKWLRDIIECNKLEFYSDIKSEFKIEPYLNLVENRSHKNTLTRQRIRVHSLHIEIGPYKRFDKSLKAYTNTPRGQRKYPICTDDIEDEYHFLFKCTNKKKAQELIFEYLSETHKKMKRMKRTKSNFFSTQKTSRQSTNLPNLSISHFKQNQKNQQTKLAHIN